MSAGGDGKPVEKDFHFPPLVNGLDFLASTVASLSAELREPSPREVKYAVLHLQLAAEILFKARLEMHDPKLVWGKPGKFDEAKHRAGDFYSCGIETALERLHDHVGIQTDVEPTDADLAALGNLRNRIVHFGWQDTTIAVQARTVPVLDLLLGFLNTDVLPHLPQPAEAWAAEQQMEPIRAGLRHLGDVVRRRHEAIRGELSGHEGNTLACRSCGQFAVVLDGGASDLACLMCGKPYGTGPDAAWEYLGDSRHVSVSTGGGDLPQCECCGEHAVISSRVAAAREDDTLICFGCGTAEFAGVCASCDVAHYSICPESDLCTDCWDASLARF